MSIMQKLGNFKKLLRKNLNKIKNGDRNRDTITSRLLRVAPTKTELKNEQKQRKKYFARKQPKYKYKDTKENKTFLS